MNLRPFASFACLAFLVAAGFGCKKTTQPIALPSRSNTLISFPSETTSTQAPTIKNQNGSVQAVDYLRIVLKNFSNVKSFRASLKIPINESFATGQLEAEGTKMHGTLQLPGPVMTELYLIDKDIWFRSGKTPWENLAGTTEGEETANLLRNAFSLSGSATGTSSIGKNAVVTEVTDDPSGCKLFVVKQPSQTGQGEETITLCVKNDLPTFIAAQTPDGKIVEVRYWDYNKPFNLYAPVRK